MEVILIERVHRLGDLGERVKVKSGYARNYLIPSRKAVPATAASLAKFETARGELIEAQELALAEARSRAEALENLSVTIRARAGSEGRLFGSVGTLDIATAVTEAGVAMEKKQIRLPQGPLREIGTHEVRVHLHPDVDVAIKVVIAAEDEGTS
ncbi:MAG: 50S ribosomal protein L9 [Pseudomonadota bacterium]|nr:50S ribosomal protein L9 [Pseudomonadota bacterium]